MSGSGGDQLTPDEAKQVLHWLQRIERLRTLQPEVLTAEDIQAVNDELPYEFYSKMVIAAVCRGMLRASDKK